MPDFLKKTSVIILLLLPVILIPLHASNIKGTGTGKTEAEALQNSRADCIQNISVSVISAQDFITASKDGVISNDMTAQTYQYATMELIGKQESVKLVKGVYHAETVIPESSAPAYATRVNETWKDASEMKKSIDAKGNNVSSGEYLELLTVLKEFDAYRSAVSLLDPKLPEAMKESVCGMAMIESLYRSTLQKESNGLEMTVEDLERKMKLGILEEEGEKRLEEARKNLAVARQKQEEEKSRQEKEYATRMTALQQQIKISVENMPKHEIAEDITQSLSSLFNSIEADRSAFSTVMSTLRQKLATLENERKTAVRETEDSYNRIPLGERTVKNGKVYYDNLPEDFVLEQRKVNRQSAISKINDSYKISATDVYNEYFPLMKEIRDHAGENMARLNSLTFVFSTDSEGVNAWINDMDYQNCRVMAKCALPIGDTVLTVDLTFPFRDFIVDEFISPTDIQKLNLIANKRNTYSDFSASPDFQETYMTAFGTWYRLVSEYPELFSITIDMHLKTEGSHKYTVYIDGYTIYRNTEGGSKEIYRDNITRTYTIYSKYYTSFDYMTGYEDSLLIRYQMKKDLSPLIPDIKTVQAPVTDTTENKYTDSNSDNAGSGASAQTASTKNVAIKTSDTKNKVSQPNEEFCSKTYIITSIYRLNGGEHEDKGETYFTAEMGYRPNRYFFISGGVGFSFSDTYRHLRKNSSTGRYERNENGNLETEPNCGSIFNARIGLSLPGKGPLRFDGTLGVSTASQHYYSLLDESKGVVWNSPTRHSSVDITYGISFCTDIYDEYGAGSSKTVTTIGMLQARLFGMISYDSLLGRQTGGGVSFGVSF